MTVVPPLVEALPGEPLEKMARSLSKRSAEEVLKKDIEEVVTVPEIPFQIDDKSEPSQVFRKTRKYWVVIAAFYYFFFVLGLNGGGTGPLLPRYQEFYEVDYLTVSMVFVSNACGSLTAAGITHFFGKRLQFSTIVIAASLLPFAGYSIMASAPPFGVMCMCFFINGINFSLINVQVNGILALLPTKTPLGLGHSLFGAGALVAPLIATQFAQLPRWSFYYLILLGAALGNFSSLATVFWGRGLDEILQEMDIPSAASEESTSDNDTMSPVKESPNDSTLPPDNHGIIPRQFYTPLLALFTFICVGVEVSIGGWIVTFIINERGGGPSSGYVSTGYYAGLSFGRAALIWVNNALGERNAVFLYISLVIALELTIWFVHSLIANAVAAAVIGSLLGPLFPIVMSQARQLVPRSSLTASIGWIAAMGQIGSAMLPFATGALANRYGILALQPLIVAMMTLLGLLWFLVPPVHKTTNSARAVV